MTITRKDQNNARTLVLEGRLDTTTAPLLEAEIKDLDGVESLVLDFEKLEYISSAGLRAVLLAQKTMASRNGLVVRNPGSTIKEVFDITGFSSIINIE